MQTPLFIIFFSFPLWSVGQIDTQVVRREVDSLIQLHQSLLRQKKFEESLQIITAATGKVAEAFGKEHELYATCLLKSGNTYCLMNRYDSAEPLYLKALTIREKLLGKESLAYSESLQSMGDLYYQMGRYKMCESFYTEDLLIREKLLGKESFGYAESLNNLGVVYWYMNLYEKAEPLLLEALFIKSRLFGKDNSDYVGGLVNLGLLYKSMGNYEKSELMLLEGKEIFETKLNNGKYQFYYNCLTALAALYYKMANYEKAEILYYKAKSINEQFIRKQDNNALSLYNIGLIYKKLGDYKKSETLLLESASIREKIFGKEHPRYAESLALLGTLYLDQGDYEKSTFFILESINIKTKTLGKANVGYAGSLINLGVLYDKMGLYEKSEMLYLEAKDIFESKLENTKDAFYINCIGAMASRSLKLHNYTEAETLLVKAKLLLNDIIGKENSDYKHALMELATLYWLTNELEKAKMQYIDAINIEKSLCQKNSYYLSEREMSLYNNQFIKSWEYFFSFAQIKTEIYAECYDNLLFHKGFLLNSSLHFKKMTNASSPNVERYYLLKSYHRRLATQYAQPISDRDSALIADLEQKANTLEKELVRTVAGFGEALRQVTWQEVQQQLRPGEAAIEFVHYHFYTPHVTDSVMYAALVLRHGDTTPHFIPLFEERQIAALLKGASGGNDRRINECYGSRGHELFALIWKPLEGLLNNTHTVYCSPSGLLHRLNLGAIPAPGQQTFGERRRVITLGSTRQLVPAANYQAPVNAALSAAVFGGIRYEMDTTAMPVPQKTDIAGTRGLTEMRSFYADSTSRGGNWKYLPGTRAEALDISKLLQNAQYAVQLDTGYRATEETFRHLGKGQNAPRILHIATHGYFYPDPKEPANSRPSLFDGENMVFKKSDNPMMRSGLILAGANQAWMTGKGPENREDGILTAYEISHLDLSGTELVVLSACETGLGDIEGNEGVYGLQRAFRIAGAKYLLMSLWRVDDNSTREFMTKFYRLWLENKKSIPDAFRAAQAYMKKKYPDEPYHWAGFVLLE
ncbi:MAG: CHAT domain-containing protein [Haliscomenobacteraceae bacterium CHB4]|nr:CHAT domain-containing protein [Haliscomenobacteraceae bacterium CHB4]